MRVYSHTIDLMLMLFNSLFEYNPTIDINKRQIKFINNDNIKCCLIFTSRKCDILDIDFIKQIRVNIGSKQKFNWTYNTEHPYLSTQDSYNYVVNCIIKNIM